MRTLSRTRVRPALPILLTATGLLYLWGLGASGWANAYYSAAAQAGAASWRALLFGATDAAGGITVDKTPASVWVMGLSARLFGVNAWSILVPQALMGVGTVWLLYAAVRRVAGETAGLLAGLVLALTPVAVLMFRFNNPDALLVLLLTAGAFATVRAIESSEEQTRWLVLAGACVGFAFLTKMLQAFLVLPAFGAAYVLGAKEHRIRGLATACAALVVSSGWWVLLVSLWPASDRPYVGGSQTNSVLELTLGYNGLGRLTGDEVGRVGGGGSGGGWARLFGQEMAGGIAWLLPAAVVLLVAGLWLTRVRSPEWTSLVLWGGWLVVTALVFSYMDGIIHSYYTVALAPALAAVVGIGASVLWRRGFVGAAVLSGAVALTALETYLLLDSLVLLVIGLAAAAILLLLDRHPALATLAVAVALAGPAAYSFATAAATHSGALPSAGPGSGGMRMGGLLDAPTPGAELTELLENTDTTWAAATVGANNAAGYQLASGRPVLALGGFNGTDPAPTLARFQAHVRAGAIHYFIGDGAMSSTATGGSDAGRRIAEWVAANYRVATVNGVPTYDLS